MSDNDAGCTCDGSSFFGRVQRLFKCPIHGQALRAFIEEVERDGSCWNPDIDNVSEGSKPSTSRADDKGALVDRESNPAQTEAVSRQGDGLSRIDTEALANARTLDEIAAAVPIPLTEPSMRPWYGFFSRHGRRFGQ